MVKASNTANANYALTPSFYAQTNAIYRFYTYQLVIDDAPTIAYGQYWPLQNLTSTNLSRAHRVEEPLMAKRKFPKSGLFSVCPASARHCADCQVQRRREDGMFALVVHQSCIG